MIPNWPGIRPTVLALAAFGATAAFGSQVTYDDAVQFGAEIQAAFSQDRGTALVDRLDSVGMRQRTFGPMGQEAARMPQVVSIWEKMLWPEITRELQGLQTFSVLQMNRVMLLENARVVECVLFNERNEFGLVLLWLGHSEDGKVQIQDLHFLSTQLEMSRRLRQTFLMLGVPASGSLDEEDRDVDYVAESCEQEIRTTFRAIQSRDWAGAFRLWNGLPGRLKAKPIWHDLRETMAASGSEAANLQLLEHYRSGQLMNPFTQFVLCRKHGSLAESIAAADRLIQHTRGQPFVRVVRSGLLNQAGQHQAALDAARDIYEYYPSMNSAYLVALQAAVATNQTALLTEILARWALVVKPEEMDRQLKATPALEKVAASVEFQTWREAANR